MYAGDHEHAGVLWDMEWTFGVFHFQKFKQKSIYFEDYSMLVNIIFSENIICANEKNGLVDKQGDSYISPKTLFAEGILIFFSATLHSHMINNDSSTICDHYKFHKSVIHSSSITHWIACIDVSTSIQIVQYFLQVSITCSTEKTGISVSLKIHNTIL